MPIQSTARTPRILIPPIFVTALVIGLHSLPGTDIDSSSWWSTYNLDKVVHTCAFSLLSLSLAISFSKLRFLNDNKWSLVLLIVSSLTFFGTILELIQGEWMVGRTAESFDILADCAGSVIGIIIFRGLYGVFPGKIPINALISNPIKSSI
ncbi:MAG: hypothetical protein COA49_04485 [Bacteroidetes bacterium]|nr:MAG: hypothetical protein COA49_04485 [Bacteroidota bacterium]